MKWPFCGAKNMQSDVLYQYLDNYGYRVASSDICAWGYLVVGLDVTQLAKCPYRIMDVEEKYCNIYDLDSDTSAQSYVRKLQELDIYLTGYFIWLKIQA